jgi:hypothetical protein
MSEKNYILKETFIKIFWVLKFISKVEFFCFLILLYIFVLLAGTIEQKNFGLQFAQDSYFNSNFIVFFNFFPMLGGKLIFTLVFLSLIIRLCFDKWNIKRIGTILLHFGVLFLLFGAFVNNFFKIEGHLIIKENNYNNFFVRDDLYNLNFINKKSVKEFNRDINVNVKDETFVIEDVGILNIYRFSINCVLSKKKKFLDKSQAYGVSRFFLIKEFPSFVEQEENRSFLLFNFASNNSRKDFNIIDYNNNSLNYEDELIKISLSKKNEQLPFKIYLSKFEKINYSGTQKAKNYISNLIIEKNNIAWKTKIEMNKPLRINNYTLYQTSFLEGNEKSTVLTVVENTWSFYPYVAIMFIFLGFFSHLVISFRRIRIKNE